MIDKKLPAFVYFLPFYNIYRLVVRIRWAEKRVTDLETELRNLRLDVDYMRQESYKEVQFYEARIETIYQRMITLLDLDPDNASIAGVSSKKGAIETSSTGRGYQ